MKHLVAIALSASVALFSGIFSAQTLLAQAQDAGYSDAYIKFSGSYIG